jgi:hypothetical protein
MWLTSCPISKVVELPLQCQYIDTRTLLGKAARTVLQQPKSPDSRCLLHCNQWNPVVRLLASSYGMGCTLVPWLALVLPLDIVRTGVEPCPAPPPGDKLPGTFLPGTGKDVLRAAFIVT